MQRLPAAQTVPQAPQLLLSVWSARQVPEQLVCPAGHEQVPPEQLVPPVQMRPHIPQLVLSVGKVRQVPEQSVCPARQVVTQALPMQI